MAKRFSATEKWQDEWFSQLKPLEKLVFLFIVDNCDNAGFFEVNARLNSFIIGITQDEYLGAIKGLNKGYVFGKCGKKIFVVKFLLHQKNLPLNIENNAHKQILSIIEMNKENFEYDFSNLGAKQGLLSPIGKGIGIGNNKEGENFKNKVFEQFRIKLDKRMYSDNFIENKTEEFIAKYPNQNINKMGALIGSWLENFVPDIQPKRMVI